MRPATRIAAAALLGAALACAVEDPDANVVRGRGLKRVELSPVAETAVYAAAVRASWEADPGLVLMAHPRRLPRTAGYEGGDPVPADLVRALRKQGVVTGTCEPKHEAARDTPRCPGPLVGYVIRTSAPVRVGGDTIQINFAAEAFAAATGARPQALRFEKIYQLVGDGTSWRVARAARVREPR